MNKEDVEAWLSSPITRKYLEYIHQEIEENKDISNSPLLNNTIAFGGNTLEQLGIDSLSRASAVKALEFAINADNFKYFLGVSDES